MIEHKASVQLRFVMTCPRCGKQFDAQPLVDSNYKPLYERFTDIITMVGGETNVPVECEWCNHEFTISAFKL